MSDTNTNTNANTNANAGTNTEIEAAVLRRLLQHLDDNKQVQNIELMNLAGFCRNCLAKWYVTAAQEHGVSVDYEEARERIYGMPYEEWKSRYQAPASTEQLSQFAQRQADKSQ